ncbi:MAG TPA: Gfo/Idh/MocA family oxidoreductase [Candidatus Brocadiia bacterium]|nr:Gfo/Idh/MocA family oxidoreductase [Candidatus Brocadiia bacterium]
MRKLRIGIVGMGQRTCHHGEQMFSDCKDVAELAAVCDNRPERLALGKAMYEKAFGYAIAGYNGYQEMYDKAELDAVFIAGPNWMHRDMTLAAFQRGLHVLCEKPLDVSIAKCDEMIAAAKKAKRVFGAGMQMHYRVRYHKVAELIAKGVIGAPVMAWCTEYRGPFIEMKDWVWEKDKSGGAIVEKNCHHYDILSLWIKSNPTTVYATGSIAKHFQRSGVKSQIVDNAWILNDYENAARAMVGICFLAEKNHYREFGVNGTEGRVYFSSNDDEILHVELNNGGVESLDYRNAPPLRGGMCRDFVDSVRDGRDPLVTGLMARQSLLIPLAAEMSIAEKRVVNVSEVK